jgi:hypothetical protein
MKKLTKEAVLFCEEYVRNGYNASKAYRTAHPDANDNTCAVTACKLLKDKRVQDEIEKVEGSYKTLAFNSGIDKKSILEILKKMMQADKLVITKTGEKIYEPDYTARNSAIITYARLTGELTDKKKIEIEEKESFDDMDLENKTEEELKELQKKLLEQL